MSDSTVNLTKPHTMPTRSPWGAVQYGSPIGDQGIFTVSTSGHGGVKVPAALNRTIHEAWRRPAGWYEEDCEWAIVAYTFPLVFAEHFNAAVSTLKSYFPDEYETVTGETVTAAESYIRAKQEFERDSADKFVVHSAIGTDVGSVKCWAKRQSDGAEAKFLVVTEDYHTRGQHGFIIDESRHPRADFAF